MRMIALWCVAEFFGQGSKQLQLFSFFSYYQLAIPHQTTGSESQTNSSVNGEVQENLGKYCDDRGVNLAFPNSA